ncbi:MAG: thrombospondin type 3 repeat-containing protein [Gammaproteobacteria bacterium]|nr:thrombospondin type 3 repeat-containing protein [Gammaproteobacteria bacterium]
MDMTTILARTLWASLVFAPVPLAAQEYDDGGWYAVVMASLVDEDGTRGVDNGFGSVQIGVGTPSVDGYNYEFNVFGSKLNDDKQHADFEQLGAGVDFIRKFGSLDYFQPYALLGVGWADSGFDDSEIDDQRGPFGSVGLGVLTPVKLWGSALRVEVRMRGYTNESHDAKEWFLSFGLQVPVNRTPLPVLDADGDGVSDKTDRCQDTPPGSDVTRFGCARVADSDGDGVPDFTDMCGGTPAGMPVDRFGCRLDGQ